VLQHGRPGAKYNIGGTDERRNIDVVRLICQLLASKGVPQPAKGVESLITFVADRPAHDLRYAIDARKIESQVGLRCERTFESVLSETIDWYLANVDWWRPIRRKIYAGQRLGAGLSATASSISELRTDAYN